MYITKMYSINRAHYTIVHTGHSFGDSLPWSVSMTACLHAVLCDAETEVWWVIYKQVLIRFDQSVTEWYVSALFNLSRCVLHVFLNVCDRQRSLIGVSLWWLEGSAVECRQSTEVAESCMNAICGVGRSVTTCLCGTDRVLGSGNASEGTCCTCHLANTVCWCACLSVCMNMDKTYMVREDCSLHVGSTLVAALEVMYAWDVNCSIFGCTFCWHVMTAGTPL